MKKEIIFVSGIDTAIGKSYATGFLAREWNREGIKTITQKFIQTGNTEISEDIEVHRQIMGTGLVEADHAGNLYLPLFAPSGCGNRSPGH